MGYHFVIDRFVCPDSAKAGEKAEVTLSVDNVGVAPIYKKLPLVLQIGSVKTAADTDITRWLPGKHEDRLTVQLPHEPGEYDILLGIECPLPLYFASDAPRQGTTYRVGHITVR